jgi:hypothetical protein
MTEFSMPRQIVDIMTLTNHLHRVSRSRVTGVVTPHPQYAFMAYTRTTFVFSRIGNFRVIHLTSVVKDRMLPLTWNKAMMTLLFCYGLNRWDGRPGVTEETQRLPFITPKFFPSLLLLAVQRRPASWSSLVNSSLLCFCSFSPINATLITLLH